MVFQKKKILSVLAFINIPDDDDDHFIQYVRILN